MPSLSSTEQFSQQFVTDISFQLYDVTKGRCSGLMTISRGSVGGSKEITSTIAVVVNGGSNYAVNDTITLINGTVLIVLTVDGSAVTAASVQQSAAFFATNNPYAQAATSGNGTGATFTLSGQIRNCITLGVGSTTMRNQFCVSPDCPPCQTTLGPCIGGNDPTCPQCVLPSGSITIVGAALLAQPAGEPAMHVTNYWSSLVGKVVAIGGSIALQTNPNLTPIPPDSPGPRGLTNIGPLNITFDGWSEPPAAIYPGGSGNVTGIWTASFSVNAGQVLGYYTFAQSPPNPPGTVVFVPWQGWSDGAWAGAGATAKATLGPGGSVVSVTILNPGGPYPRPPLVCFAETPGGENDPPLFTGGVDATGVAVLAPDGSVAGITITNPGSGYIPGGSFDAFIFIEPLPIVLNKQNDIIWTGSAAGTCIPATGFVGSTGADLTGVPPQTYWSTLTGFQLIAPPAPLLGLNFGGLADAGAGYTVGDILTIVGGAGTAAQIKVTSVNSGPPWFVPPNVNGAILGFTIVNPGAYSWLPVGVAEMSGGTGSGAEFNIGSGSFQPLSNYLVYNFKTTNQIGFLAAYGADEGDATVVPFLGDYLGGLIAEGFVITPSVPMPIKAPWAVKVPSRLSLAISGIKSGPRCTFSCNDCEKLNGTWTLTYIGPENVQGPLGSLPAFPPIAWQSQPFTFCGQQAALRLTWGWRLEIVGPYNTPVNNPLLGDVAEYLLAQNNLFPMTLGFFANGNAFGFKGTTQPPEQPLANCFCLNFPLSITISPA